MVLAKSREVDDAAREALRQHISDATIAIVGEPPDDVVLAPPHTVLKTSSGKIRRSASRELYEAGAIGTRTRTLASQIARLVVHALVPQTRRYLALAGELLYAGYAAFALVTLATVTWIVTAVMPRPAWAWAIGGASARTFFRLIGVRLLVRGVENLPRGERIIARVFSGGYIHARAGPHAVSPRRVRSSRACSRTRGSGGDSRHARHAARGSVVSTFPNASRGLLMARRMPPHRSPSAAFLTLMCTDMPALASMFASASRLKTDLFPEHWT